MNINLIGVPISYGCDKYGCENGPDMLKKYGIVDLLNKYSIEYSDLGNIYVPKVAAEDKLKSHQNIKYYDAIYDVCNNLAKAVYESLKNQNFTMILGGDHSLAMGSISGASKYFENLGVVWIDAHGDFNTDKTTESKNAHGMPLAALCGYGDEKLVNIYEEGIKIEEENVYHIGGRDFDINEKLLMEKSKINMYSSDIISKRGFEDILNEIINKCERDNLEGLHISLDIDFLDGSIVLGTGTRVSDGYSVADIKYILDRLFATGLVRSIDLVEFNPTLDNNNKTLEICMEIAEVILKNYTIHQ